LIANPDCPDAASRSEVKGGESHYISPANRRQCASSGDQHNWPGFQAEVLANNDAVFALLAIWTSGSPAMRG
jgi:hypothetical protein